MSPTARTDWIIRHARALDFNLCGVAPAKDWPELERLPEWLDLGHAGEMRYLHDPRRQSPQNAMLGTKSVVVCALNYNTPQPHSTDTLVNNSGEEAPRGWISRYAWGTDYHEVLGAKLEALLTAMRTEFPEPFDAKWYVGTPAPFTSAPLRITPDSAGSLRIRC